MALDGIDISHHQGDFNLKVVAEPLDFVIIKATEGNGYVDPQFSNNLKKVRAAGKLLGLYHYARSDLNPGTGGAKREAAWFVKTAGDAVGEGILILDWENESLPAGPSWATVWLEEVERLTGVRPFFYCYPAALSQKNFTKILAKYPFWLASYGPNTSSGILSDAQVTAKLKTYGRGHQPDMYQYLSTGRLPGHAGNLDLNKAFFTAAKWREYAAKKGSTPVTMPRMQSPVEGRVSSPYGTRGTGAHWGMDITCPVGTTVLSPFAKFRVAMIVRGRKPGQDHTGHPLPFRSPNGVVLANPDGEHQWLGHVDPAPGLKVGDEGDFWTPLGKVDLSGKTTGGHVHLETWATSSPDSHRDPQIYFSHNNVRPGSIPYALTHPKNESWFDMATRKDLEDAIWNVLSTHNISISGATREALNVDKRSAFALLRYAAAGLFEGRAQHADLVAQNRALTAAVEALSKSQGVDPGDITGAVREAVDKALADLKVTLTVEGDLDE